MIVILTIITLISILTIITTGSPGELAISESAVGGLLSAPALGAAWCPQKKPRPPGSSVGVLEDSILLEVEKKDGEYSGSFLDVPFGWFWFSCQLSYSSAGACRLSYPKSLLIISSRGQSFLIHCVQKYQQQLEGI